jgi:hypothetical protein
MRAGIIAAAVLAVAVGGIGGAAQAADNVKIGVIYPLTGNAASAGQSAKDAVNLAAEIVNTAHPELKNLPLGATAGLPNLGGAKIELDEADHQGNPQVGQQQTVRLITQDRGRRTPGRPLSGRRLGRGQHHRARLQMDVPHHAVRAGFRQGLFRLPQRAEEIRQEDRLNRRREREHRLRHLGLGQRP